MKHNHNGSKTFSERGSRQNQLAPLLEHGHNYWFFHPLYACHFLVIIVCVTVTVGEVGKASDLSSADVTRT